MLRHGETFTGAPALRCCAPVQHAYSTRQPYAIRYGRLKAAMRHDAALLPLYARARRRPWPARLRYGTPAMSSSARGALLDPERRGEQRYAPNGWYGTRQRAPHIFARHSIYYVVAALAGVTLRCYVAYALRATCAARARRMQIRVEELCHA